MTDERTFKGRNCTLVLTERGVIFRRGFKGWLSGGGFLRGDKTIPYSSIMAVQLKKAGMMAGYLQLSIAGGPESKAGLRAAMADENTISFGSRKRNAAFEEAKRLIEERMELARKPHTTSGA